jgi:hypothetical protein
LAALGKAIAAQRTMVADVLPTYILVVVVFYTVAGLATWMVATNPASHPVFTTNADRLLDLSWHWDGEWYMSIVTIGYYLRVGFANVAFFPLFPLLVKWVGLLLEPFAYPDHFVVAGVLVSNTALLLGLFYLYKLAAMEAGRSVARRAVWLAAIMPTAFFFHVAYPESLLLLTAVASLYHLRRGEFWWAALWAAVGSAARVQGAILALPIIWEVGRLTWQKRRLPWRQLPTLVIPFLGIGLFMLFLYQHFGDALAFVHIQKAWDRSFAEPLGTLTAAVNFVIAGYNNANYPWTTVNIVVVLFYLAVALLSVGRWPFVYTIYVFASILLAILMPVPGRPIESGARFMAVVFPVIITLARWSEGRPWLERLLTSVSLPLFALFLALFANWYWVT